MEALASSSITGAFVALKIAGRLLMNFNITWKVVKYKRSYQRNNLLLSSVGITRSNEVLLDLD